MNQLKVVIDTNVLVSALLRRTSIPHQIHQAYRDGKFIVIISPEILKEIGEVIHREYIRKRSRMIEGDRKNFIKELYNLSVMTEGKRKVTIVKADPDDNKFIAAALEGEADYIVTGDIHLLSLKEYKGVRIVTPREFTSLLLP